jgi:hypothetical protein
MTLRGEKDSVWPGKQCVVRKALCSLESLVWPGRFCVTRKALCGLEGSV